jgi:dTDP-4-amino-4,6-dideoxygalactose transaminase
MIKKSPATCKRPKGSRSVQEAKIPALRPLLPRADRLLPHLRTIDATRHYTNWGPLTCEFEHRLSLHFGLPENGVVTASSGTAALVGAILAIAGHATRERPLAIIPALTFVATAVAAERCGYRPYLVDVDAESWLLDAGRLDHHPFLNQIGVVIPVAAYGRPVPQGAWIAFRDRTRIPVVIDGGASFEAISANPTRFMGEIPTVMSFHATKSFATAEGGCVTTTDSHLSMLVTRALNFGFYESRDSRSASTNGKMSEYHAAIGLAELDVWPAKCRTLARVAARYRQRFEASGLAARFFAAPSVAGCYALFRCSDAVEVASVQESFTDANIEFRFWYGGGLLDQPHFSDLPHDSLKVTEQIALLTIGLPVAVDLADWAIERVVSAIESAAHSRIALSDEL